MKKTIVVYSLNPWEHALPLLRIVAPGEQASYRVIPGNHMETVSPGLVALADLVFIQRDFPRLGGAYREIRARARERGIPIVYDLDDLLVEIPEGHPDSLTGYYSDASLPVLQAVLDADLVTTSTLPLASYLSKLASPVRVLPNYLIEKIWPLRMPEPGEPRRPVTIGYVGSHTHAGDVALLSPTLRRVLQAYGEDVRLYFWGVQPPEDLRQLPNVAWEPLKIDRYAGYAAFLSGLRIDIALSPLEDTLFNRCKSAIKYLEYSALGIPGVYSLLDPYEAVVVHGQNGLLAETPDEWAQCLSALIDDPVARYRLASGAQETLRQGWLLSQHAAEWQAAFESLPSPQQAARRRGLRLWTGQAIMKARVILAPPGSRRERLLQIPQRSREIWLAEGPDGLLRRLRRKLGSAGSPIPALILQQPSPPERGVSEDRENYHLQSVTGRLDISNPLQKASIVILTYNNLNYTRLCLEGIFSRLAGMDFEAIVVDNASTDGTPAYLQSLSGAHSNLRVIWNDVNMGFARGNNLGASRATGDVLVFLNNDTLVTPGWLGGLAAYLDDTRVGMVGPLTNSSGNESQVAVSYRNFDELERYARQNAQHHSGEAFHIRMLGFFCVALRRGVFDQVGGLDDQFGLGLFEDDDYCLRVRQAGYLILCAKDVFVHHWGEASFSQLGRGRFYRLFHKNRRRFEKKWGMQWAPHRN